MAKTQIELLIFSITYCLLTLHRILSINIKTNIKRNIGEIIIPNTIATSISTNLDISEIIKIQKNITKQLSNPARAI